MLDLPITNGPNFVGSYVTQRLTGDSKIPSNLNDRYFDFFGSSAYQHACTILMLLWTVP